MKKDLNNMQPPDQEKYWKEAEKMLDRHYEDIRKSKRRVILIAAALLLLVSGYVILTSDKNRKISDPITGNIASENTNVQATAPEYRENNMGNIGSEGNSASANTKLQAERTGSSVKSHSENEHASQPEVTEPKMKSQSTAKGNKENIREANNNVTGNTQTEYVQQKSNEPTATNNQDLQTSSSIEQNVKSKNTFSPDLNINISGGRKEEMGFLPVRTFKEFSTGQTNPEMLSAGIAELPSHPEIKNSCTIGYSIYATSHYISKKIDAPEMSDYLHRRREDEKNIILPGIGASFLVTKNNLSLSLGLEYSSIGEKTNYDAYKNVTQYTYRDEWQTYLRTIIDIDTAYITGLRLFLENEITFLDSSLYTYVDTGKVRVYDPSISERNGINRYSYVEVPFVVHLNYPVKRFTLGVSAGISPAWLVTERGYVLNEDESGVTSIREKNAMKTFILNGRAGIDIAYSLNPSLQCFINPHVKHNLSSASRKNQSIQQKYTATGVNVGFIYTVPCSY